MSVVTENSSPIAPKLLWVLKNRTADDIARYESYWKQQRSDLFDASLFQHPKVFLEIGSGSGWMRPLLLNSAVKGR